MRVSTVKARYLIRYYVGTYVGVGHIIWHPYRDPQVAISL